MTAAVDALESPRGWIECVCPEQEKAKKQLEDFLNSLVSKHSTEYGNRC